MRRRRAAPSAGLPEGAAEGSAGTGAAAREGAPLLIYPHVPKCAGSTAAVHLATHLGEGGYWIPRRRARGIPPELLGRKWSRRGLPAPAGVRAVIGHVVGRSVADLFPGRAILRVTLLRAPDRLQISWYNFRMMRYRMAGQRPYPFALHLACQPPDPVAHFLLANWLELSWPRLLAMGAAEKRDRLDAMLGSFDRVADIAEANDVLAMISRRLGIAETVETRNDAGRWEAASGWQPIGLGDLSADEAARLAERTTLDRYLWRRWAKGEEAGWQPGEAPSFAASEIARAGAEIRRRLRRGGGRSLGPAIDALDERERHRAALSGGLPPDDRGPPGA